MRKLIVVLLLLLVGCTSGEINRSRSYYVDCGAAVTVGSGSCGLTVTSVGFGQ